MRVMVLGLRGIPGVQGGVETHAEKLYPLLVEMGCEVDLIARSPYVKKGFTNYQGVRIHRLWSPKKTGIEAIVHSVIGVLYAAIYRPDILHIHAIGPSIVTPLARLLGIRVIVTHHGPDYDRDKWNMFAKMVLRTGEALGMRFSNQRIVISNVIKNYVRDKYGRKSILIPNGVTLPDMSFSTPVSALFDLQPRRYFLQVSRVVPEKRQLDLIRAFSQLDMPGWKLVLVGSLDSESSYVKDVKELANATQNVILSDFQTGEALQQLYANAGGFILPSSHEGLPIALLEALSYGIPVLASDIPANLEIGLPDDLYFHLGDTKSLTDGLRRLPSYDMNKHFEPNVMEWLAERYDWKNIAKQTYKVYESIST